MFLTNHTLTGVVLGQAIDSPLLLAPAAFASHLAMDSLPHFGSKKWPYLSRPWYVMAVIDNLIALSVFGAALILWPERRAQTVIGVFFACLPDLLFLVEVVRGGEPFLPQWRRF